MKAYIDLSGARHEAEFYADFPERQMTIALPSGMQSFQRCSRRGEYATLRFSSRPEMVAGSCISIVMPVSKIQAAVELETQPGVWRVMLLE